MNVLVTSTYYTPELLRENPTHPFVFGDNTVREGKGGQAIIRDEPNSFGIVTKRLPSKHPDSYFSDDHLFENLHLIATDILDLYCMINDPSYGYTHVVFPSACIGTGLSDMPNKCPYTYNQLCYYLRTVFKFDNTTGQLL
jgi:hypothetical protein